MGTHFPKTQQKPTAVQLQVDANALTPAPPPPPPSAVLPTLALFFFSPSFKLWLNVWPLGKSFPRTHMQPSQKRNQHHPCHSDENVPYSASERERQVWPPPPPPSAMMARWQICFPKLQQSIWTECCILGSAMYRWPPMCNFVGGCFWIFQVLVITMQCEAQCRRLASRGWTKLWKNITSPAQPPPLPLFFSSFFTVSEITSPVTFTGIVEIRAGWYVNWVSDGAEA